MPGAEDFPTASKYRVPLSIYALEEIKQGEEVCISYLAEVDQLSPLRHRRSLLEKMWGFVCSCDRCEGGRPLDRRLEGIDSEQCGSGFDRRTAMASVDSAFRSLFDSSFEHFDPPQNFETTVERLTKFRKDFGFLDQAHTVSQRIRKELLAAFLFGGVESEVAQRCGALALPLLVEEMHVQHALLPCLSPCKITSYARFLKLLRYVPEKEAQWHVSELKMDGCELQHQQSLWLHDPKTAKRLGLSAPRNLPARPLIGAPLRTGPQARLGAACAPAAVARHWPQPERVCFPRSAWKSCRRKEDDKDDGDEMPPLMQRLEASCEPTLWDAYAEFGQPSREAQRLRGRNREVKSRDSWFKFRVAR